MDCQVDYRYLRPKKAAALKKWYDMPFEKITPSHTAYPNAVILPLKQFPEDQLAFGRGGVVDEQGNYVDDSAIDRRVQYGYDIGDNIPFKDEKVVYCGYLINHWGHFLIEAVSRLWYFLEGDTTIDKYVFFLKRDEERTLRGNYKEFFVLLGIWDKLEIINTPTCYREVIVPQLGYKWRRHYSDQQKAVFDTIANNITVKDDWKISDKIFFTRNQFKKAADSEFGAEVIDEFFENNGYTLLAPEKFTLSEMIYYIRNAKICASISGTLPHNMLFSVDNQKLLIIERNVLNNEIQADINRIKGLHVLPIDANLAIYPINAGGGPFIFSYKGMLEKYAEDNQLKPVSEKYCSEKFFRKMFRQYMRFYRKGFYLRWFMTDWMINYTDYLYEAYLDSEQYFKPYLHGLKPYKFIDCFRLRFIKQFIKRMLKR